MLSGIFLYECLFSLLITMIEAYVTKSLIITKLSFKKFKRKKEIKVL